MNKFFNFDNKLQEFSDLALKSIEKELKKIDEITEFNQQKVLSAFIKNGVSETHFTESTGYGYGDRGREVLDSVFADIVGAEDAIVRHNFTCGTHTLSVALFGVLRPGDTVLCVTGTPYDTIHAVFGIRGEGQGSLKDFGVRYKQVDLTKDGEVDYEGIEKSLKENDIQMVYIQRSRGYSLRKSLSINEIKKITDIVKQNSKAVVMVDNCYGEFVETLEPTEVGADLMAGSLIKNPGGGLAKNGGYIAGKRDLVEKCAYRLTTPGIGREVGATLGQNRSMFMGLFNAPHVTGEALKTAIFAASLLEEYGFETFPKKSEERHDIVQSIILKDTERLIAFCQGIQKGAPVDAFVVPEPWDMPGYDNKIIMSAGTFTLGSSIELSADAPLREPFAVYMQGGLNFHSGKIGIMLAVQEMINRELI